MFREVVLRDKNLRVSETEDTSTLIGSTNLYFSAFGDLNLFRQQRVNFP